MDDELGQWDATETAQRIANGDVSASEVVEAAVARARAWQPRINAIVYEHFDAALAEATSPRPGRFSGVPTFVKDMEDVAGLPTRFGTAALPGAVPRTTAPSVAQFLTTGVVCLGKSTTSEFGFTATTEPVHGAPTRNPLNLDHSSGGSSGGAAALVAAHVVPIAHGGDGGGSIRIPAAFCGLIGLKASRGRLADMRSAKRTAVKIATYGVLTRTVRDTAAFYATLEESGHSVARSHLPPIGDVRGPGNDRWRIGVYTDNPFGYPLDPVVDTAVQDTARRLEAMGHTVDTVGRPYGDTLPDDFLTHWMFLAASVELIVRLNDHGEVDRLEPWTRSLSRSFRREWWRLPRAIYRLRRFARQYDAHFRNYDVLLSPVTSSPAPPIGHLAPDLPYEDKLERIRRLTPYTPVQNASGGPAISLPVATTDDGLPVAIQLAAATGHERRLIELAYALEPERDPR